LRFLDDRQIRDYPRRLQIIIRLRILFLAFYPFAHNIRLITERLADCNAYMAIEAQSHARLAAPFIESNMWRGPSWLRGVTAARSERYRYAREIMNIRDEDQLFA
jgi:hypothetical protein